MDDSELKIRLRGIETRLWLIENGLLGLLTAAASIVVDNSPYWPLPPLESQWSRLVAGLIAGVAAFVFARNWCGLGLRKPN